MRAWVSENDHELVKLEAEAIDNLRLGLGGLARLHKGARLSFLRRKVNGEVWLPAVASYNGSARLGLLFTLRRSGTSEYSGYRKCSVDTLWVSAPRSNESRTHRSYRLVPNLGDVPGSGWPADRFAFHRAVMRGAL